MKLFLIILSTLYFNNYLFAQSHNAFTKKATKSLKVKDYYNASLNALNALKLQPKNRKAQEVLSFAFEPAAASLKTKIENLQTESSSFKGDITVTKRNEIYLLYVSLRKLADGYNLISRTVKSKKYDLEFSKIDYREGMANSKELLKQAKLKAAEMHYLEALILMGTDDRLDNKNAAKKFKKAFVYVEDFKDAKTMYKEAKTKGTTHILILSLGNISDVSNFGDIENKTAYNLRNILKDDFEVNEFTVFETVSSLKSNAAQKGLSFENLSLEWLKENRKKIGLHAVIYGDVYAIKKNETPVKHYPVTSHKKNIDSGRDEKYQNSKGEWKTRSVYIDIFANVYKHEKKAESSASVSCTYHDFEYDIKETIRVTEASVWSNMWITFTGHEQAINLYMYTGRDNDEMAYPNVTAWAESLAPQLAQSIKNKIKFIFQ